MAKRIPNNDVIIVIMCFVPYLESDLHLKCECGEEERKVCNNFCTKRTINSEKASTWTDEQDTDKT